MPPRGSDLWRGATALGLYGDGDEELEMMKETNSRSARAGRGDGFAALGPVGQGGMTVEEEIMLTGQAATPAIAAEMAAGFVGLSSGAVREARTVRALLAPGSRSTGWRRPDVETRAGRSRAVGAADPGGGDVR